MQSLLRSSRALVAAAPRTRALHSSALPLSAVKPAAAAGVAATPAAAHANVPKRTTGNTAADIRRIFREQQRASRVASEAFPWEVQEQKVTGQGMQAALGRTAWQRWSVLLFALVLTQYILSAAPSSPVLCCSVGAEV